MLFSELVTASGSITDASGRLEKTRYLAALLRRLSQEEIPLAINFLTGGLRQGRIGLGFRKLLETRQQVAATPTLTLQDVDSSFQRIADATGSGSATTRRVLLSALFARATTVE
jgi:DNA ligase 1